MQDLDVSGKGKHVHIHYLEGLSIEIIVGPSQFRSIEVIDMMISESARGNAWQEELISKNTFWQQIVRSKYFNLDPLQSIWIHSKYFMSKASHPTSWSQCALWICNFLLWYKLPVIHFCIIWAGKELLETCSERTFQVLGSFGFQWGKHSLLKLTNGKRICLFAFCLMRF